MSLPLARIETPEQAPDAAAIAEGETWRLFYPRITQMLDDSNGWRITSKGEVDDQTTAMLGHHRRNLVAAGVVAAAAG
jgi:hypothetical protein